MADGDERRKLIVRRTPSPPSKLCNLLILLSFVLRFGAWRLPGLPGRSSCPFFRPDSGKTCMDDAATVRARRWTRIVPPAHAKATEMAIHAPSRTPVLLAVAVLLAVCAFDAVVHAVSPGPGRVSLSEATVTGGTVKDSPNAED